MPEEEGEVVKKVKLGLTIGTTLAALGGFVVSTVNTSLKILTGDFYGAAYSISTGLGLLAEVTGLDKAFSSITSRVFGDGESGPVASVLKNAWNVATSNPIKLALKATGIAIALATATTPLGWAIAGLSIGAMTISTINGAMSVGRSKRRDAEAARAKEALAKVNYTIPQGSNVAKLLAKKLEACKPRSVDAASVGAFVSRNNILESGALIMDSINDGGPLGIAASVLVVSTGVTSSAEAKIERIERENRVKAERDSDRTRAICAMLAADKTTASMGVEELEARFNSIYDENYKKSLGEKVKNGFKDLFFGIGGYIKSGLSSAFAKPERGVVKKIDPSAFQAELKAKVEARHLIEAEGQAENLGVIKALSQNVHALDNKQAKKPEMGAEPKKMPKKKTWGVKSKEAPGAKVAQVVH